MPIEALDFDADAIRIARANARANRAGTRIRFRNQDVAKVWRGGHRRYSFICANLTADVLVKHRAEILDRLESSGKLVLAGILDQEFAKVRRDYEAAGLRLLSSRREKEWRSGTFARQ